MKSSEHPTPLAYRLLELDKVPLNISVLSLYSEWLFVQTRWLSKGIRLLMFNALLLCSNFHLFSQSGNWQNCTVPKYTGDSKKGNFLLPAFDMGTSFTLLGKIYILLPNRDNNFFEYDPTSGRLNQRAKFPKELVLASSFVIMNYAYVCGGYDLQGLNKQFFKYDALNDLWLSMGAHPFRFYNGVAFSAGNYGYCGTGTVTGEIGISDFWKYDPVQNEWEKMPDVPGTGRMGAFAFSINGKGYVGCGNRIKNIFNPYVKEYLADFHEFDPETNQWIEKSNFPGNARAYGISTANKYYGFVGTGEDTIVKANMSDIWKYDANSNLWIKILEGIFPPRVFSTATALDDNLFIYGGRYSNNLDEFPCNDFIRIDVVSNQIEKIQQELYESRFGDFFSKGSSIHYGNWVYDKGVDRWNKKTGFYDHRNSLVGSPPYFRHAFDIGNKSYFIFNNNKLYYEDILSNKWIYVFDIIYADTPELDPNDGVAFFAENKMFFGLTRKNYQKPRNLHLSYYDRTSSQWHVVSSIPDSLFASNDLFYTQDDSGNLYLRTLHGGIFTRFNVLSLQWEPLIDKGSPGRILYNNGNIYSIGRSLYSYDIAKKNWTLVSNDTTITSKLYDFDPHINNFTITNFRDTIFALVKGTRLFKYIWGTNAITEQCDFPGSGRYCYNSALYGDEIILCHNKEHGGGDLHNNLWIYSSTNDSWRYLNNFNGKPRYDAQIFFDSNYIFYGLGFTKVRNFGYDEVPLNDWHEYSFKSNTWNQLPSYPGAHSDELVGFHFSNQIILGFAGDSSPNVYSWKRDRAIFSYNISNKKWNRLSDFPVDIEYVQAHFIMGNSAFLILGRDSIDEDDHHHPVASELWRYNLDGDSWQRLNDCPFKPRSLAMATSNDSFAIFGLGIHDAKYPFPKNHYNDLWKYYVSTDSWAPTSSFPNTSRYNAVGRIVGKNLFVGFGHSSDVWNHRGKNDFLKIELDSMKAEQVNYFVSSDVNSTEFCSGDSIFLISEIANNINWLKNDSIILRDKDTLIVKSGGRYTLNYDGISHNGQIITVNVNPLPDAQFEINQVNDTLILRNMSANYKSCIWEVNGETDTQRNSVYYLNLIGDYYVLLTVENDCGVDTLTKIFKYLGNSLTKAISQSSYSIYPNPTDGMTYIKGLTSELPYVVFNSTGSVLLRGVSSEAAIDLNCLSSGIYFIRIGNVDIVKPLVVY